MLALLKANPNAFVGGNVNALRQGAVLRVPDADEINSLSATEALNEVKRQHALWQEYRQSASASIKSQENAVNTGASSASTGADQIASNTDQTASSDGTSTPEGDASRLVIATPESGEGGAGGNSGDVVALRGELDEALEKVDIQRHENAEMHEQLQETTAIIAGLERMVKLKDDEIAALQNDLAQSQTELEASIDLPAAEPETTATGETETTVVPETETTAVPETETSPEEIAKQEPISEPAPTTLMDFVRSFIPLDNPLILAAVGGGILLLAILGVVFAKRRRNTDLDDLDVPIGAIDEVDHDALTETGVVNETNQLPAMEEPFDEGVFDADEETDSPPRAPEDALAPVQGDAPSEEEDDPLEGLNIYLAYEDYDNATKLVKDVIVKHPDRHEYKLRLLEIHYASKNISAFQTTAKDLRDVVGEESPMLDSALRWWDDLSPGRGLFEAAGQPEDAMGETHVGLPGDDSIFDVTDARDIAFGEDDTMEISLDDVEAEGDGGGVDFDLGFEFGTDSEEAEPTDVSPARQDPSGIEPATEEGLGTLADSGDLGVDFDLADETDLPDSGFAVVEDGDTIDFELDMAPEVQPGRSEDADPDDIGLDDALPVAGLVAGAGVVAAADGLDFDFDSVEGSESAVTELPPADSAAEEDDLGFDLDFDMPNDALDISLDSETGELASPETPQPHDETTDLSLAGAHDDLSFALDESSVDDPDDFSLDLDAGTAEETVDLTLLQGENPASGGDDLTDVGLDFALDLDETPAPQADIDGLDFALDIGDLDTSDGTDSGVEAATGVVDSEVLPGPGTVAAPADSSLEFALDVDDLDVDDLDVDDIGKSPGGPQAAEASDDVDFSLDFDTSGDLVKDAGDNPAVDDFDFALDLEKSAAPEKDDQDGFESALELPDDLDVGEDQEDVRKTQYSLRDVPEPIEEPSEIEKLSEIQDLGAPAADPGETVFVIDQPGGDGGGDIDLALEIDDGVSGIESADDGLDFQLDFSDESPATPDFADSSLLSGDGVSSPDLDESLDISLDFDDTGGGLADDLEQALGATPGATTVGQDGSGGDQVPTLDFDLDTPGGSEATPEFETVQLRVADLAAAGAISEGVGGAQESPGGAEVDGDFADIFGGPSDQSDDDFELDLPDSALMSDDPDTANSDDLDFEFSMDDDDDPVAGESDAERTQYLLRDIANITSDDGDDPFALGGSSDGDIDEMQTKLDLAQAYIDMGDSEGARNILGEVLAEGQTAQQDLARQLLAQLN